MLEVVVAVRDDTIVVGEAFRLSVAALSYILSTFAK